MKNRKLWIVVGIAVIAAMLLGGLLPLPGQKDNVTPHSQPSPSGQSPQPALPKGPPHGDTGNPLSEK